MPTAPAAGELHNEAPRHNGAPRPGSQDGPARPSLQDLPPVRTPPGTDDAGTRHRTPEPSPALEQAGPPPEGIIETAAGPYADLITAALNPPPVIGHPSLQQVPVTQAVTPPPLIAVADPVVSQGPARGRPGQPGRSGVDEAVITATRMVVDGVPPAVAVQEIYAVRADLTPEARFDWITGLIDMSSRYPDRSAGLGELAQELARCR